MSRGRVFKLGRRVRVHVGRPWVVTWGKCGARPYRWRWVRLGFVGVCWGRSDPGAVVRSPAFERALRQGLADYSEGRGVVR